MDDGIDLMANRLQFNPIETEILWCSSARRRHEIPTRQVRVSNSAVLPQYAVRDLGVDLHRRWRHYGGSRYRDHQSLFRCTVDT